MLTATSASAQIAKCYDKSGKVVAYGSECPPGTRSEQTAIPNNSAFTPAPAAKDAKGAAPSGPKSLAEQQADFKKRQAELKEAQEKDAKKAADTERRKQACEDARSYLKLIESGQRVTRMDPKTGERSFMEDDQRAIELSKAQRGVAENCK